MILLTTVLKNSLRRFGKQAKAPAPLFSFVLALARELSDETAYARHLEMSGHAASAAEWKLFSERRYRAKYQNAKCC